MTTETTGTHSDDRILSAISHLFGILVALIVWATHKEKSASVRFQAVQAIAFDVLVMVFFALFTFCLLGVMFAGMFASMFVISTAEASGDSTWPFLMLSSMFPFTFLLMVPVSLGVFIVRLIAAISILNGKDFRYPWLGKQVEKLLEG